MRQSFLPASIVNASVIVCVLSALVTGSSSAVKAQSLADSLAAADAPQAAQPAPGAGYHTQPLPIERRRDENALRVDSGRRRESLGSSLYASRARELTAPDIAGASPVQAPIRDAVQVPATAVSRAHVRVAAHDKIVAKTSAAPAPPTLSLDQMTRDGSAPTAPDTSAAGGVDVTGAIARMLLALIVVLALAAGVVHLLRRAGYGQAPVGDAPVEKPTFRVGASDSPATVRPRGVWKAAAVATPVSGPPVGIAKRIEDFELMGYQPLTGTNSGVYKVRSGDRILLLGCSVAGVLTVLSEWDTEAPAEMNKRFDSILDEMQANAGLSEMRDHGSLKSVAQRLEERVQRLAGLGRDTAGMDTEAEIVLRRAG